MSRNEIEPLMTVDEAAAYLRVSPKTIRNRVSSGTIPSLKAGGGRRFRQSELDAWIRREGVVPAVEPAA